MNDVDFPSQAVKRIISVRDYANECICMVIDLKLILVYRVTYLKVRSATLFTADAVCSPVDSRSVAELC